MGNSLIESSIVGGLVRMRYTQYHHRFLFEYSISLMCSSYPPRGGILALFLLLIVGQIFLPAVDLWSELLPSHGMEKISVY